MSITINGLDLKGCTVNGKEVKEITIDGKVAWRFMTAPITPIAPMIIDDFERTELQYYTIDAPSNSAVEIVSNRSYNGNKSLRLYLEEDTFTQFIFVESLSGLPVYPFRGCKFSLYFAFTITPDDQHSDTGFHVNFAIDPNNVSSRYSMHIRHKGSSGYPLLSLKKSGHEVTYLAYSNITTTLETGQWYKLIVDWKKDGTITVTIQRTNGSNVASVSAVDTDYSSGGLGFAIGIEKDENAIETHIDYVRLEEVY